MPFNKSVSPVNSIIFFIIICVGIFSCDTQEDGLKLVITKDYIYVSSEILKFRGEVLNDSENKIIDHGFYVSENEEFNNPTIITLGNKSISGAFIGEINGLPSNSTFYYKAFASFDDSMLFGDVQEVSTLQPSISSFSPKDGIEGEILEIRGKNFGLDVRVFIGEQPAEIIELVYESKIKVKIPQRHDSLEQSEAIIRIESKGHDISFEQPFQYITGKWLLINELKEINSANGISFLRGDQMFYGLTTTGTLNKEINQFNFSDSTWAISTQFNYDLPIAKIFMSSDSYFVGVPAGMREDEPDLQLWVLEESDFLYLANLPITTFNSTFFKFNNQVFLIGGYDLNEEGGRDYKSINRFFDLNDKSWNSLNINPVKSDNKSNYFLANDNAYIISIEGIIWELTSDLNWNLFAQIPVTSLQEGKSIVVNNKAYFLGNNGDTWELDLDLQEWKRKNILPSALGETVKLFLFNNKIHALYYKSIAKSIQIWQLDPSAL